MSNKNYIPQYEYIIFPAPFMAFRPQFAAGVNDLEFKCNHLLRAGIGVAFVLDGLLNKYNWEGGKLVYLCTLGFSYRAAVALMIEGRRVTRDGWPAGATLYMPSETQEILFYTPDGCLTKFNPTAKDLQADDWRTVE